MLPGKIFISYRRDDSAGYARLLYDRLSARFPGRIFMDISGIEVGSDFVTTIEQAVSSCAVLIVLIEKKWLTSADSGGRRRLDDPGDFVRLEIATALEREILVIPVLLRNAAMPTAEELPLNITLLARRQALELSDANFDHDVVRLIGVLERELGEAEQPKSQAKTTNASPARRFRPLALASVIGVLAFIVWWIVSMKQATDALNTKATGATPSPQQTSDIEASIKALGPALGEMAKANQSRTATQPATTPDQGSPKFQFDAVGKWQVTVQGAVTGHMLLYLKADHTYEIAQPAGALSVLSPTGTWTFNTNDRRLVLLPERGRLGFGVYFTDKRNDGYYAKDDDGLIYVFKRS